MNHRRIIAFLLFFLAPILTASTLIKQAESPPGNSYYELFDTEDCCVGFVAAYEIPIINTIVIHSLYVPMEHRGHGYGQESLELILKEYTDKGYAKAYLQIGPYERDYSLDTSSQEYHERVNKLKVFYQGAGFEQASWLDRCIAELLYPYWNIHLPSEHLFRKNLT